MAQTLNRLVEGIRHRDPASLQEFVERFEGMARSLSTLLIKDVHLAEDAVQESFIEAVNRIDMLRDGMALPGWFRQIVRTQACRIHRRRVEPTVEQLPDRPADDPTPLRRLEDEETLNQIRQALAGLTPPNMRTAELFYVHGYSMAEVAEILNVPTGTVKRRLHDARNRLRSILIGSVRAIESTGEPDKPDVL